MKSAVDRLLERQSRYAFMKIGAVVSVIARGKHQGRSGIVESVIGGRRAMVRFPEAERLGYFRAAIRPVA